MLKPKTVLGIDIGSLTVKLVELAPGKNAPVVTNHAIIPIPDAHEIEEGDLILHSSRVAYLLQDVIREKRIRSSVAAVSISSRSVFTRFVKMPFSDEGKLQKLIVFEAQQQIPFELERVHWDYQIVGKNEEGDFEVLIAAIKREILNQQLMAFKETPVTPVIVDVGAAAIYNALVRSQIKAGECVIILDIGANPATLVIHHPEGYWVRSLAFASHAITQTLMRDLNVGFEEAEALKFQGQVTQDPTASSGSGEIGLKVNQVVTAHVKKLYTEIMRSLSFYRTQFKDIQLDRMILSGAGSRQGGVREFLGQKFGIPVDMADPLEGLTILSGQEEGPLQDSPYLWSDAVGLALRQVAPCKVELNLISMTANLDTLIKKNIRYYYIMLAIIACTLAFGLFMVRFKTEKLQQDNRQVLSEMDRLNQLSLNLHRELHENKKLESELVLLQTVSRTRRDVLNLYLDILAQVPKEIYLRTYRPLVPARDDGERRAFTPQTTAERRQAAGGEFTPGDPTGPVLVLRGIAQNRVVLDQFTGRLESLDGVQTAHVVNAAFLDINEGKEGTHPINVIDFELHMTLGVPETSGEGAS